MKTERRSDDEKPLLTAAKRMTRLWVQLQRQFRSYKTFDALHSDILLCENHIRSFFPKCYADSGDYEKAGEELLIIAQNFTSLSSCAANDWTNTPATLDAALSYMTEEQQERVKGCPAYREAIAVIERMGEESDSTI